MSKILFSVFLGFALPAFAEPVQFVLEGRLDSETPMTLYVVGDRSQQMQATQMLTETLEKTKEAWQQLQWDNPTSALGQLNVRPEKGTEETSPVVAKAVFQALEVANWSEGHFNPAYVLENDTWLTGDYHQIQASPERQTVTRRKKGLHINVGPLALGLAADTAAETLVAKGWNNCYIATNDIYVARGQDANGPWKVPVEDPSSGGAKHVLYYKANNLASATHRGGEEKSGLKAVTVFTKNASHAAAFAATLYKMGKVDGPKLLIQLKTVKAIFLDNDGRFQKIPAW